MKKSGFTKTGIVRKLKQIYREHDRTGLFRLYHEITGERGNPHNCNYAMTKLFEGYCTSGKMRRAVDRMCDTINAKYIRNERYDRVAREFYGEVPKPGAEEVARRGRAVALKMLRRLAEEDLTRYSKVAMFGRTHLYFCSPAYGHRDYNKVCACPLGSGDGDPLTAWCDRVVKLSDRIYEKKLSRIREREAG